MFSSSNQRLTRKLMEYRLDIFDYSLFFAINEGRGVLKPPKNGDTPRGAVGSLIYLFYSQFRIAS